MRILASRAFARSGRMQRFLEFTVEEALAARGAELKEALVGIAVFDRSEDYDPRIDPIVRVEARRLRAKLEEYYQHEGSTDRVRIEYPRGSYVPVFCGGSVTPVTNRVTTIAVLPFENLSVEAGDEYFSAGLSQELIHSLTRLPGLRVMAWNSAQRMRQQENTKSKPVVDAVLEGSVRRSGSRVRIAAQLVDSSSGLYVWADTYERQLRDLLTVQEELAQAIARALHVRLSAAEPLSRSSQVNIDAYTLYLRGRHTQLARSEESLRQGAVFFELALRKDPNFPLAYAGLADAYGLLNDYGFEAPRIAVAKSRAAVERALELDPNLAEAHASLASLLASNDWDWRGAEKHFRRAIELNPGFANAHHWFGIDLLALVNRMDEAGEEMQIARELNPLDPVTFSSECYLTYLRRDYTAAERAHEALQEQFPDFVKGYAGLARVYGAQGRYAEALEMFERARFLVGNEQSVLSAMGQIAAQAGQKQKALEMLRELEAQTRHVPRIRVALIHLGLGDKSTALDCIEEAYAQRETQLTSLAVHPIYDDLRNEPRFRALLEKLDLPVIGGGWKFVAS